MAQFDVYRNSGKHRDAIPYVVTVQSSLYDDYRRRVVIPLARKSYLHAVLVPRFNPTFQIENTEVVLHPLEIVSVDVGSLGAFVVSLAENGQQIIEAIDALITRAHR